MFKRIVVFLLCLFILGCGNTFDTTYDKMVITAKEMRKGDNQTCYYCFENRYFPINDYIIAPYDFADIGDIIVYDFEKKIIKVKKGNK